MPLRGGHSCKHLHCNLAREGLRWRVARSQGQANRGRFGQEPVKKDHYSVLGVTPASEDVVIRAAYRALMRRYHPDADSSAEAAERAREINEAYRVVSDPDRRARYDEGLKEQSPLKFEPEFRTEQSGRRPWRLGPAAAIGFAALAAGMVAFAVSPSLRDLAKPSQPVVEEERTTRAKPPAVAAPIKQISAPIADLCADPSANGLIKAELFKRAAELRPAERAQLERVASHTHLRIDSTSVKGSGCSGWLAINLPRGLVVDGIRSNLNAEAAFDLVRGEGGLRLARLSGVDGLVRSLATLGPPGPVALADAKEIATAEPQKSADGKAVKPTVMAAKAVTVAPKRLPVEAEGGCADAASQSDRLVCADGNLSTLDRQLALLYRQSWKQADAKKRAALIGTRQRFNDRRAACGSSNCMTTAYVTRLREISDIMAGKDQQ
jgi:curved DNA-binding protein CbpA